MNIGVASEAKLHRRARKLDRLATSHGIGHLYCGGDGVLLADLGPTVPHFVVAQFCVEASELLGGSVELLSRSELAGHRVPDDVRDPHPL